MGQDPLRPTPSGSTDQPGLAVVTGTRAEFGLLERSIDALQRDPDIHVDVIVSGMHLVPRLGFTAKEVEERFEISRRVEMDPPEDTGRGMARAVASGLCGFSEALEELEPEAVLVLGDRTEVFAASVAAEYLGIPVAHIHGGDRSGSRVDDFHRDAVSRIARLHFPATRASARRLEAMSVEGEVEVVGAPGLDAIVSRRPQSREALAGSLGLREKGWLVVLHHPLPTAAEWARDEMVEVLGAARQLAEERGLEAVVIYPNNDAGHRGILDAIESAGAGLRTFASLKRQDYLDLCEHGELLIGNSSSGIIESASLGLTVVNVGQRQMGRERNANVVDADPAREAILTAARQALRDPRVQEAARRRDNLYGDGKASERIARRLGNFVLDRSGVTEVGKR